MSRGYGHSTEIEAGRTRGEIVNLLRQRGATGFGHAWDAATGRQFFEFKWPGREGDYVVRMIVPMPDPEDPEFLVTPTGRPRSKDAIQRLYSQAVRQRWHQMKLIIVAKLEAIEIGVTTFDREFLADLVTAQGATVYDVLGPSLTKSLGTGALLAELAAAAPVPPSGDEPTGIMGEGGTRL